MKKFKVTIAHDIFRYDNKNGQGDYSVNGYTEVKEIEAINWKQAFTSFLNSTGFDKDSKEMIENGEVETDGDYFSCSCLVDEDNLPLSELELEQLENGKSFYIDNLCMWAELLTPVNLLEEVTNAK